jgi:hypothetical protein
MSGVKLEPGQCRGALSGEHEDLGDMLVANDGHKDRVRQLGTPARRDSAMIRR